MFRQEVKDRTRAVLSPVAEGLARGRVSANALTMGGFLISCLAGWLFATGRFAPGAIVLLVSGIFDVLDGAVARAASQTSKAGAFLDSTVDRYSELAVYLGLGIYYLGSYTAVAVLLSLAGAAQVSYTRARAEGLGEECFVGWFQRPERTILLVIGGLLGPTLMTWVLWAMAVLTNVTSLQRMWYVEGRLRGKPL